MKGSIVSRSAWLLWALVSCGEPGAVDGLVGAVAVATLDPS